MDLDRKLFEDRSDRGKLRFTGPQRGWFLDQLLTQRLDDMGPGDARAAAMLTVHGRMTAYLEIVATEDALLAHFEPDLLASLPEALRGYVFATQVEIEDVTDLFGLVLVAGPGWTEALGAVAARVVAHPTRALGVDAAYLWVPIEHREDLVGELAAAGFDPAEAGELERLRIANGVPRWGAELDRKTLPQEAGIDAQAVHYEKGCYLGQEAMAKIHFRGKVNRRLARLEADADLGPGTDLMLGGEKVGTVTSAAGRLGLGLVKHTVGPGASLSAAGISVRVV